MTTTELIKMLKGNECGGISHKPREISLTINGKYMPNPQITLSSTGDGICGAEIDLDIDGDFMEEQEPKTDIALERYKDLQDYFTDKDIAKAVLENQTEFKAWLERLRWNTQKVDELARKPEALEREPCEDAISRRAALDAIPEVIGGQNDFADCIRDSVEAVINACPSVQPKVVPIAEIKFDDDKLHEIVNEAIKDIEIAPRWILVRERLPKSHGTYQVTIQCEEGRYTNACYFDGSNTWHNDNRINHDRPYVTDKVIAWQEEPEPYEEESEDL